MTSIDPSSGKPLPSDAIQRILHITSRVHVYQVPPLTSNKGHSASQWTGRDPIFTARIRIIETAIPSSANPTSSSNGPSETVTVAILLEDRNTGELFAGAPYNQPTVVEQCVDSSRFFAVRVAGEGGRKATLGVGFEERSDAIDFGIALQDARKVLGWEKSQGSKDVGKVTASEPKKDYSLKEGEMIKVNIGLKGRRLRTDEDTLAKSAGNTDDTPTPLFPPPPSGVEVKNENRNSWNTKDKATLEELGFDDGEFGEFQ